MTELPEQTLKAQFMREAEMLFDEACRASDPMRAWSILQLRLGELGADYAPALSGEAFIDVDDLAAAQEAMDKAEKQGRGFTLRERFDERTRLLASESDRVFEHRSERVKAMQEYGLLPKDYSGDIPLATARWLNSTRRLEGPVAEEIAQTLRRTGWCYVSHVTKAAKLTSIARHGVIDGGMADLMALPGVDRRPHGEAMKQDILESAVFCSFWPAWWLFTENHLADTDVVILLIDAEAVCLQPDCAFIDRAVRSGSVSAEQLREGRNTNLPEGLDAWRSCWNGDKPYCTKEQQPEIICDRVHPAQIKKVLFVNEEMQDRYWSDFRAQFEQSWPDFLDQLPDPQIGHVSQAGAELRFPRSYRQEHAV